MPARPAAEEIQDAPQRVLRDYQLGTGSIGGWEHSALRSYYYETLLPLIPENVRAHLKTVLKNHPARNTAGKEFMQTTGEKVCMPSKTELFDASGDVNQSRYKALFPDNPSRVKKKLGNTDASKWRLRTAFDYHYNYTVQSNGNFSNVGALSHDSSGVSLCFFT